MFVHNDPFAGSSFISVYRTFYVQGSLNECIVMTMMTLMMMMRVIQSLDGLVSHSRVTSKFFPE